MASAQQKPKKDRGTRNSARRNGKAFKRDYTQDGTKLFDGAGRRLVGKGKPSFKSCLGVDLVKIAGGGSIDYTSRSFCNAVMDLYQRKASRHGWTEAQAEDKATEWLTRYTIHSIEKRNRILAEAKLIEVDA